MVHPRSRPASRPAGQASRASRAGTAGPGQPERPDSRAKPAKKGRPGQPAGPPRQAGQANCRLEFVEHDFAGQKSTRRRCQGGGQKPARVDFRPSLGIAVLISPPPSGNLAVLISAPPGQIVPREFQTALRQGAHRDVSDGGADGAVLHLPRRAPIAQRHWTLNPQPSSDPVCICRTGRRPHCSIGPDTLGPSDPALLTADAKLNNCYRCKKKSCKIVVPALTAIPVTRFAQHRRATSSMRMPSCA